MPLETGARLGPYEIVVPIGAGGMGEVYRACDTRLDRTVAVKVLPPDLARDPERRQRFAREARAVARLTHPHICTLYEFDTQGDVDVLVMEYLEGETLARRLTRGALPLAEALRLAIQIAAALAAAHNSGIVHRDLKPGNIMLTGAGAGTGRAGTAQVKLLDFGLARLRVPGAGRELASAATATDPLTGEGTIVGTLQYMAPEQLEGRDADARADLFALGAILYEMLTGQKAFEGGSQASLIAAILAHDPPSLVERAPLTPPALERVVRKCLVKDPDVRWHDAHDLADELRWILDDSSAPRPLPALPQRRPRVWKAAAAALALVPLAGVVWWAVPRSAPAPATRTIPLTSYPGMELNPALSPDGEQVAFTWRGPSGDGPFKLYVKFVEGGGDPLLIHEGAGDVFTPAWAPDGRQIAFIRHLGAPRGEPNDGLFLTSALGGPARQLAIFRGDHGLSWSPDGTQLAFAHGEGLDAPDTINVISVETGARQRLTDPPPNHRGDSAPRYSPDGRTLAFIRRRLGNQADIYVLPVTGGDPKRLTFNESNMRGFDWRADGRALVFSALLPGRPTGAGLWIVPAAGGQPEPLSVGEVAQFPSVSSHGRRLVYEQVIERYDIWRMGGPAAREEASASTRWIASTSGDYFPAYAPDGRQVAFTSHRSGHAEIWIASSDGSNPWQLTFLRRYTMQPDWSPDGRQIAFVSPIDDHYDVYVVSSSGGIPRRLTTHRANDLGPSWSGDGQWIYFFSDRSGDHRVWKVPVDGGEPTLVTHERANRNRESPDRRFLYFTKSYAGVGPAGLWRVPLVGGPVEHVLRHPRAAMWTMFDRGICYLNDESPQPTIECLDFDTSKVTEIRRVGDGASGLGMSVSPDGRWILYSAYEGESDIMLVENFR